MIPCFSFLTVSASAGPTDNLSRFIAGHEGVSYAIGRFIMNIVDWLLSIFGLDDDSSLVTALYAAVVLGLSLVVGYVFQWLLLRAVEFITRRWSNATYKSLKSQRFFHKICRMVPPIVFLALIQVTLSNHNKLAAVLSKITFIYMVIVFTVAVNALIMTIWQRINARANKKRLPLGSLAQLAKGIAWIIASIVIIALIVDRSPLALLTGLGAFSAVLMLIFKNNILSVVAGVQLSENDSLHVGDWIAVDGTNANGLVQEVSLVSVKVLNWDKTTTMLPPYSLISSGFTNYRSMQDSNTRRVQRSFMIDADSVLPATPDMLAKIRRVPLMDAYISKKLEQQAAGRVADVDNPDGLVDGTIDTNLGLFRAYVKMWLDANPHISHDSFCFVTTLAQTAAGIPLQVYCFTSTSKWTSYEAIQASIFEHIAAMLKYFGLYTFENPSGRDTVVDGFLSPGKNIGEVFGIPAPFFRDADTPTSPAVPPAAPPTA